VAGMAAGHPPPPATDPDGQAVGCPSPPLSLVMEAAVSEGNIWGICPHRGSRAAIRWEASAWAYGEPITVRPVELGCCAGCHNTEPEQLPAFLNGRTFREPL
jgi:hypothetical protein